MEYHLRIFTFIVLIACIYAINVPITQQRRKVGGDLKDIPWSPINRNKGNQPQDVLTSDEVPDEWDWRWANNTRLVGLLRNQHNPGLTEDNYCGSCWAVSSMNMLNSRYLIMNRGKYVQEVFLSVQDIINCAGAGSCEGGSAGAALEWGAKHGFVDETCQSYLGRDGSCTGYLGSRCYTCNRAWTPKCQSIDYYEKYYVDEVDEVSGEENMKAEIYSRGPIVASIHDPPSLKAWNATDENPVYEDPSGEKMATHNVAIVGYGVTSNGTKYWTIMNSWGTSWNMHDQGFVKVIRGIDNLGIESNGCIWATLKN